MKYHYNIKTEIPWNGINCISNDLKYRKLTKRFNLTNYATTTLTCYLRSNQRPYLGH